MSRKMGWRFLVLTAGVLAASVASAHNPIVFEQDTKGVADALKIPKPEISFAIYSNLDSAADVDFYSFQVTKPMPGHVTLIVPVMDNTKDFYPIFAVVGPGLPQPKQALPFELPDGYGAIVKEPTGENPRPIFFEAFARKNYYEGIAEFKQQLTTPGTYYIVVWHPSCETGPYVIGYGDKEQFTLKDWAHVAKVLPAIKRDSWMVKRAKPAAGVCKRP